MPAPATKPDLITVCDKDFAKLMSLLHTVDASRATERDAEGWSIRDVVIHRSHWIHLTMGWDRTGRSGAIPEIPAPGYKWNDLKAYNANVIAEAPDVPWREALQRLQAAHDALMSAIAHLSDAELFGAPMPGGNGKWTTGRYFAACGASHYRSAAKFIRKRLREQSAPA
ncbi:ClbS/DfsB family four-helix bundle protein [Primorskyibacter sp. S187A]|uniref:ClbS/DfsB family four-helix bundle protein n=1 Tax=Primorskyibacter sp. S187A TaxID=3415130 RepID=UPI003C7E5C5A